MSNIIKPTTVPKTLAGHHLPVNHKIALESGGFLVSEMAQAVVGVGVVAVADLVIPKPILSAATQTVSKLVVEPFLDPIEAGLSKMCRLQECKLDNDKPREQRAEAIAKTMIVFGTAYAASMLTKLHVRREWNKHFKITTDDHIIPPAANATSWQKVKHYSSFSHWTPQEKVIFAADEGIHLGSLFLINNTLAPYTDQAIKTTSSLIQKVTGCSEQKAHEVSSMAWVWEAANGLGAIAGIGVIAGNHKFDLSRKIAGLLGKSRTPN